MKTARNPSLAKKGQLRINNRLAGGPQVGVWRVEEPLATSPPPSLLKGRSRKGKGKSSAPRIQPREKRLCLRTLGETNQPLERSPQHNGSLPPLLPALHIYPLVHHFTQSKVAVAGPTHSTGGPGAASVLETLPAPWR